MIPNSATKHLLTVWNPSYASDPMDEHLRVLLDWAGKARNRQAREEDVYVWWAKIRSPNRRQELPHLADIVALQEQIEAERETHLYLTDYRSLYVSLLDEITIDNLLTQTPMEADHAPSYYEGKTMDAWFRLSDVRRLVANDTPAVIEELKKLRNTRYFDRPVSLYGGIVDLPLIVTRDREADWFADRGALTEGRLWAERDAALRGETERMAQELRDNLIGRSIWAIFEPGTAAFLASAEAVFRTRRDDPAFDFSTCAVEYAKAVELEVNALVFRRLERLLARAASASREVWVDGTRIDMGGRVPHQGLGAVRTLLLHETTVQKAIRTAFAQQDANWILGVLPSRLEPLAALRNPAAHTSTLQREDVVRQREAVLGIGEEGLVVQLARAKLRAQ